MEKLKGKVKKAAFRLAAIEEEVETIGQQLKTIYDTLVDMKEPEEAIASSKKRCPEKVIASDKKRCKVEGIPGRLEFKCNGLDFYIDFTVAPSENSDPTNIQGIIIYGVRRTLCFPDLIMKGEKSETKALIQFSVNRHGIIQSNDALEDTWSLQDKEHDLLDLHYRALDFIWGQALDWVNENIVP